MRSATWRLRSPITEISRTPSAPRNGWWRYGQAMRTRIAWPDACSFGWHGLTKRGLTWNDHCRSIRPTLMRARSYESCPQRGLDSEAATRADVWMGWTRTAVEHQHVDIIP